MHASLFRSIEATLYKTLKNCMNTSWMMSIFTRVISEYALVFYVKRYKFDKFGGIIVNASYSCRFHGGQHWLEEL